MNAEDPNRTTPQENFTRVQEETQRDRLAPELSVPGFEIEAPLGRGGMGAVYRAKQTGLNRTVALKMLLAGSFADANLRARFLLEAESVAALEHPHIVKVFAFGESGGHPYLAMEYAPNGALSERVPAGGLPAREAAQVVAKLAGAVAHAHSRGVVHRDIKPQNVLIGADNEPRLTDFGLAKVGRADHKLSVTGQVLGTPAYMAPEQAAGKINEVGTAADVYALGAVLYDLCTGRPPFQGDSIAVTLQKVLTEEPDRPRALNPAVPRDVETICLKCLEKDPAKRYATAQELADDLLRWLRNEPIAARPAGALERATKWVKRNKVAALAGAAVTAALLVGTVVRSRSALRRNRSARTPKPRPVARRKRRRTPSRRAFKRKRTCARR
jgi:serine/threonine protein kinase